MISLDECPATPGGTVRSPPAYADLTAGTSFTLPPTLTNKSRGTKRTMTVYSSNSLPNIDQWAGSCSTLTRTLPRLKDRMANRRLAVASTWQTLQYVVTRKLRLTRTFELWRSHIKQVEGHFGTAVASYFVLLRWLFYMNMAIFVVWTLFVSIPQFILEHPVVVQATNSCIYRNATGYTYNCPRRSTAVYLINCTVENSTVTTLCTNSSVAATVVPKPTDVHTSSHNYCNISSAFLQEWSLCTRTPVPLGFLDLVTGRGALTNTWLFLGHYSGLIEYNGISYNRPVAIMVCTAVVYGISFVMLIISIVKACTVSNVKYSPIIKANFCNKVFSAWDYKITHARAAKLKKMFIKTELQEELAEHRAQTTQRTSRDIIHIVLIRIATNVFVIALMVGCGASIIEATVWSWNQLVQQSIDAQGLLVPILVIFSIVLLPFVFHIVAHFERHKTRSGHEKITLLRSTVIRMLTLIIYIVAAYAAIQCTQSVDLRATDLSVATPRNKTVCRQCWETFIGQQFYNLQILEFLFIIIFTIVYETGRNLLYKAFHNRVKNKILKSILSRASFSIADSVNDLMYYQLLMWLGFFFCPALPLFQIIILLVTFYVKKYSLMLNLESEKDALFRGTKTTVLSTIAFLVVLGCAVFPVGYAVSRLQPSSVCGPFKNKGSFLSVITDVLETSSVGSQGFFQYISSSAFIVPFILVLVAVICIQAAVNRARAKLLQLTVTQLDAEGVQLIHIDKKIMPALVQLRRASNASRLMPALVQYDTQSCCSHARSEVCTEHSKPSSS